MLQKTIIISNTVLFTMVLLMNAIVLSISVQAGTLENLERERAMAIKVILNPELTPAERQEKMHNARFRLIDLERMVLRDESLKGRNTPTVRKAFKNYDLTFMVHAAIERNMFIFDNWLDQLGVSTQNVMSAKIGRR